jgi:hypothetical protein
MSTERELGIVALRQGDVTTAVSLLETASQLDPQDYQALLYLGTAYGQDGRHAEAVRVLTQAVTLQPSDAQARYNLGVALERAGFPAQALEAYQQAWSLDPTYTKAENAVVRMESTQAMARSVEATLPTVSEPIPMYAAPQMPSPSIDPTIGMPPFSPSPPGGPAPTAAPQAFTPPTAYPATSYAPDNFSLKDAWQDWWAVLLRPRAFFAEQVGQEGMARPMASLVLTCLLVTGALVIGLMVIGSIWPGGVLLGPLIGVVYATALFTGVFAGAFMGAGIHYLVGKMFGNRTGFGATFRAYVFSATPIWTMIIALFLLIPPMVRQPVAHLVHELESASASDARTKPSYDEPAAREEPGTLDTASPSTPETENPGVVAGQNGVTDSTEEATTAPDSSAAQSETAETAGADSETELQLDTRPDSNYADTLNERGLPISSEIPVWLMVSFVVGGLIYSAGCLYALILRGIGLAHLQQTSTGGAIGTILVSALLPFLLSLGLFFMMALWIAALVAGVH